jgi:AraC-like DNA-binding protein
MLNRILDSASDYSLLIRAIYLIISANMTNAPIPLFTSQLIHAALGHVTACGGSSESVRVRAGFSPISTINDKLTDIYAIERILECAAEEIGDPCFGLNLGEKVDLRVFGTISFAVANAPTVGIGLSNLIRYQSTYSRNFRCFYERKDVAMAGFDLNQPKSKSLRHVENLCIAVVVCTMRSLIGEQWQPLAMGFEHPAPAETAPYRQVIGCTPEFSYHRSELSIGLDLDEQAIPFADRRLLPVIQHHLEEWAGEHNDNDPLLHTARMEIARGLCDGTPVIDAISRQLLMSSRTLQRKLAAKQTSFRALVGEVRKRLVREYLQTTEMDLLEIALLLGYSDLSAFDHAFREWFDESPSSFRRQSRKYGLPGTHQRHDQN